VRELDYPMIETPSEYVIPGLFQSRLPARAQAARHRARYKRSSIDAAMRDAFRKARRFLMTIRDLTEDEAISLLSVGVDFG
jgi:acetamidase/formamidase